MVIWPFGYVERSIPITHPHMEIDESYTDTISRLLTLYYIITSHSLRLNSMINIIILIYILYKVYYIIMYHDETIITNIIIII